METLPYLCFIFNLLSGILIFTVRTGTGRAQDLWQRAERHYARAREAPEQRGCHPGVYSAAEDTDQAECPG